MTTKAKIIIGIVIFILSLATISAIYAWYSERNKPPVSSITYVPTPQIKEVVKIQRVEVPVEKVVTIEKTVIVEKLKLPDWVKTDANKQIIATAEVQPYDGLTNAIAIMDTKTGVSEIIAKQVPLPLFGFENKKELGVRVGYTTDAFVMRSTVYGRWSFVRVGNIHLGIYGEANSHGEGIGQVEISYKF